MVFKFSNGLWSILPIVLWKVRLSMTNWGQCRRKCTVDPTSWPHLLQEELIRSSELCLHFCSHNDLSQV